MNDPKMSVLNFELPTEKKTAYVRAARRNEQKLIPWIMDALDVASTELGLARRLLQFAQTQTAGMTQANDEAAYRLALDMLYATAGAIGPDQAEAAYLYAANAWRLDEPRARDCLIEAAALGHAAATEWVTTSDDELLIRAVEHRRDQLESDGD